jgi:predicted unusual protein kinase regulating ubiquinone biosynthesis (AarF/ABC1/UbiB family)
MKAAQLLATIPDALPPEYARELGQLQANAPAMGWAFVKRRMATELGPDWQARFGKFDKDASFRRLFGASPSRDPAGRPRGGGEAAIPDMASALEADLDQLKVVFAVGQRFDPAIRTDEIQAEIRTRLREELDYRREAKHVALYRTCCATSRRARAGHRAGLFDRPAADHELARGEPLLNWKARSQEERDVLAINMFRAWYVPFYVYGVIHGDPHLGNYTVRPTARST